MPALPPTGRGVSRTTPRCSDPGDRLDQLAEVVRNLAHRKATSHLSSAEQRMLERAPPSPRLGVVARHGRRRRRGRHPFGLRARVERNTPQSAPGRWQQETTHHQDGRQGSGAAAASKFCIFCAEHAEWVDYKDTNVLRRFMSDCGKIESRSNTCAPAPSISRPSPPPSRQPGSWPCCRTRPAPSRPTSRGAAVEVQAAEAGLAGPPTESGCPRRARQTASGRLLDEDVDDVDREATPSWATRG